MHRILIDYGFILGPQRQAERFVFEHEGKMQKAFWDWVDAHEGSKTFPFQPPGCYPSFIRVILMHFTSLPHETHTIGSAA